MQYIGERHMNINKESLTEQFVKLIFDMIINKELVAGQQIPTKEIAEKYGVSVMPVRQALLELAEKKLVVNRARVGFYVAEYSSDEILQISDCRRMFELYCMENYFDNIDLDELRKLYDSIQQNTGEHFDNLLYQKNDTELHSIFIKASGNPYLINQYNNVSYLFSLCIIYDDDTEHDAISRTEHLKIMDNIFAHKKDAALLELKNHLDRVDETILAKKSSENPS